MDKSSEVKDLDVIKQVTDPSEIVKFGTNAAKVLKDIVTKANLIKNINGQEYMKFEGWQTVAKFFSSHAGIEWVKPVIVDKEGIVVSGFEARAYVKDQDGNVISTAESYCGKDEPNWKNKPLFALKSMAQTRACAKVLRQVYSWVVVLAGYQASPAEDMDGVTKNVDKEKVIDVSKELVCDKCKAKITEKVYNYSVSKHSKPLCFNCQKPASENVESDYTKETPAM